MLFDALSSPGVVITWVNQVGPWPKVSAVFIQCQRLAYVAIVLADDGRHGCDFTAEQRSTHRRHRVPDAHKPDRRIARGSVAVQVANLRANAFIANSAFFAVGKIGVQQGRHQPVHVKAKNAELRHQAAHAARSECAA